ncbi:MAG: MBL fold metallo-hydrolase [Acidobacteriota bacterium]
MLHGLVLALLAAGSVQVGDVTVVPITHASLLLQWDGKNIYVDPWGRGDYAGLPKADLILITDVHGDHLDPAQVAALRREDTPVVAPPAVQEQITDARVVKNGESIDVLGIRIDAVPMYNLQRGPSEGRVYHEKGRGNGYVLNLGETRVYISGDTECIPEMKELRDIDLAFVCMNLPYTMPPEEAAACVNAFQPKVVIPYHYRGSDLEAFRQAVKPPVEVKLLDWYPE